jgi:RNA polymerase sigma-70 factor (ECF subfamily)
MPRPAIGDGGNEVTAGISRSRSNLTDVDALTDEELVERVLDGEVALFELLMRRNNLRVYRAMRARLRDESELEDAMQAAYLLAFSKLASFRGEAQFSTWLTRLALNEALARVRRHRRHPFVSLSSVDEPELREESARSPTPEAQASGRELAEIVERALDSLPEPYRLVFALRELEAMDTAQTAAVLAVSEDVVKTRLSRARALLRKQLHDRVGDAAYEAFKFEAPRCNQLVANVMRELLADRRR